MDVPRKNPSMKNLLSLGKGESIGVDFLHSNFVVINYPKGFNYWWDMELARSPAMSL